jgi:AcrR family transcriptional regulator
VPSTTRDRLVDAGSELFRRQGYAGTGVKQIVTAASAPFASLYHFFPGGKEQLGEEVIRTSGAMYGQLIPLFFDGATDLVATTRRFFDAAADTLVATDYADACPIATVALEVSSTSEPLRQACHDVFESWLDDLAARLRAAGLRPKSARQLAVSVLALLEGAFILGRAGRDPEPVRAAGRSAAALVRASLPSR